MTTPTDAIVPERPTITLNEYGLLEIPRLTPSNEAWLLREFEPLAEGVDRQAVIRRILSAYELYLLVVSGPVPTHRQFRDHYLAIAEQRGVAQSAMAHIGPGITGWLTLHLDLGRLMLSPDAETACAIRLDVFDNLRRLYAHLGYRWQAVWVIEVKTGAHVIPHIHFLCWIPVAVEERRRIAKTMWRSTGVPVHWAEIDNLRDFRATGRFGYLGCLDYMAKNLGNTMRSQRYPFHVGKARGVSMPKGLRTST